MEPDGEDEIVTMGARLHARLTFTTVAVILGTALPAAAQRTGEPNRYVAGGVLLSVQPEGERDCPYLCPPFGGAVWPAVTIGGGFRVDQHRAFGVEFSPGGTLTAQQSTRIFTFATRHRDAMLTGVFRFTPMARQSRVTPIIVIGPGVAFRRTSRVGRLKVAAMTPHQEELNDVVPALLFGGDLSMRAGRYLAVVPFARAHVLLGGDRAGGVVNRGVSSLIFRVGVSGEVWF